MKTIKVKIGQKVVAISAIAMVLAMNNIFSSPITLAASELTPTLTCTVTQDGKDVKSDPDLFINPISADTGGGSLVWKATIKYPREWTEQYQSGTDNLGTPIYSDHYYATNFKSFTWNGTVDGKSVNLLQASDNPYLTANLSTKSYGKYHIDTYTVNKFGDNIYAVSNPNHKDISSTLTLKLKVGGTVSIPCDVKYVDKTPSTVLSLGQVQYAKTQPTVISALGSGTQQSQSSTPASDPPAATQSDPGQSVTVDDSSISTPSYTTIGGSAHIPSGSTTVATTSTETSSDDTATAQNISNSDSGDTAPLIPSPDILKCTGQSKILYFQDGEPTYDRIGVSCTLTKGAIVDAHVYNKSYDVKSEDNSANVMKTLQISQLRTAGNFMLSWDGYDDYDQAAPLDDYSFVVEAKLSNSYSPDISIQKFKVDNAPDPNTPTTTTGNTTTDSSSGTNTSTNTNTNSTDNSGLHGAANEPENNIKVTPATPSKCPGVNYPTDIAGSSLESLIKMAYDDCLVQGYVDGTFRENANLTRAEAAKIAVLGGGHIAKQGCYDSDCGSPFLDLQMWQGPWVRAAWDLKMVVGVGPGMYAPNRNITKAEASSLLTKAFAWAPHIGCYNAGCGAGYPDDLFQDIIHVWEGPYLRALWDKKAIHSETPHLFYPDKPITRGQFIEMTMKARIASPNITAVTAGTGAVGSTTAGGTTTTGTSGSNTSTPAK